MIREFGKAFSPGTSCADSRFVVPCVPSLLLVILLVGCAGEGIRDPLAPRFCTDEIPFRAELHCIQQFVFTPTCALVGCHAPPAQEGLNLTAPLAFGNIVSHPSSQDPNFNRITPGDPDNSYLIMKLMGDPRILNDQMPLLSPPLSSAEIDAIRQWVLDGALDN